ncbi:integrase [Geothermobacter hydrogeniphilus]|uniref:Integrase n=1 Tax=Geothermobacter hydrogeniphilus TaxID=1969733 RepID=A0A2K2HDU6_9BACT|nr:DnaJ C-terminal domain-containing protein [Geothermobacter hydrogeniphilus]PNU21423.1 integrase [Geothermobacter hydrogeniphilus]
MGKDYYATLGLAKGADADQIKKAYRKLALKYHPDKNPGDKQAEERFKDISEAYAVLSDPEKKQQYDQFGDAAFHQRFSQEDIFRDFDFGDIFRDFGGGEDLFSHLFGGGRQNGFHRGRPHGPRRGQDYVMQLSIPFRLAVKGGERRIDYRGDQGVEQIQVRIPAGVEDGQRLRVAGKGGHSPGGPRGDLLLEIHIDPDPLFRRDGDDLYVEVPVSFTGACLGTSIDIPTLEGSKRVKIRPGTQGGSKIRLKGFGVPRRTGSNGDLYAVVVISVPKELDKEQRRLLEELRAKGI